VNRTLKLSLISLTAIALMVFVVVATLLGGRSSGTTDVAPTPVPGITANPADGGESESFLESTEEMQLVIGALVGASGVSTWVPEEPIATQEESPYCDAPKNTVWYLTWSGSGEGSYDVLADNLINTFASNSDYTVEEVSPGVVDVTGISGFRGVVTWDAVAQTVNLELVSSCYEN